MSKDWISVASKVWLGNKENLPLVLLDHVVPEHYMPFGGDYNSWPGHE